MLGPEGDPKYMAEQEAAESAEEEAPRNCSTCEFWIEFWEKENHGLCTSPKSHYAKESDVGYNCTCDHHHFCFTLEKFRTLQGNHHARFTAQMAKAGRENNLTLGKYAEIWVGRPLMKKEESQDEFLKYWSELKSGQSLMVYSEDPKPELYITLISEKEPAYWLTVQGSRTLFTKGPCDESLAKDSMSVVEPKEFYVSRDWPEPLGEIVRQIEAKIGLKIGVISSPEGKIEVQLNAVTGEPFPGISDVVAKGISEAMCASMKTALKELLLEPLPESFFKTLRDRVDPVVVEDLLIQLEGTDAWVNKKQRAPQFLFPRAIWDDIMKKVKTIREGFGSRKKEEAGG